YDRVMVEEGLRSSNPFFSLFLGDFLGGFSVSLQPRIELFELFGRELIQACRLKFLRRHHLLNASGEDLLSRPGRSRGAKNEKRGDHQTRNRTAAQSLHHIYTLPKFRRR